MPSKLLTAQATFTRKIALLILYAFEQGYLITFGAAYTTTGHKKNSYHYKRLAIDLNLFDFEGNYLTKTKDHLPLGRFWKSLGGTWGGDFTNIKDGNHYSWGEK